MDALTIPYSHVRAIRTAARKTRTVNVVLKHDEGTTTFSCTDKASKVRASGTIAPDGAVTFATTPKRTPSKASGEEAAE